MNEPVDLGEGKCSVCKTPTHPSTSMLFPDHKGGAYQLCGPCWRSLAQFHAKNASRPARGPNQKKGQKVLFADHQTPWADIPDEPVDPLFKSTDQPEFQSWFNGSKVVDEQGKPQVFYHGTDAEDFTEFKGPAWFAEHHSEAGAYAHAMDVRRRASLRGRYRPVAANGSLDGKSLPSVGIMDDIPVNDFEGIWHTDNGIARRRKGGFDVFTDVVEAPDGYHDIPHTIAEGLPDFTPRTAYAHHSTWPSRMYVQSGASDEAQKLQAETEQYIQEHVNRGHRGRVYPVHLSIKNPKVLPPMSANRFADRFGGVDAWSKAVEGWRAEGYDGVQTTSDEAAAFPEVADSLEGKTRQFIPFDAHQIKSAIGSGYTQHPDITKAEDLEKVIRPPLRPVDFAKLKPPEGISPLQFDDIPVEQPKYGSGDTFRYDYSHLLPPEFADKYVLHVGTREEMSGARMSTAYAYRKPYDALTGEGVLALRAIGHHKDHWEGRGIKERRDNSTLEPHIDQLKDRKAAGITPYVLKALIAHARNHHDIKRVRIPHHTPAAHNMARKYIKLLGPNAKLPEREIANPYAGSDSRAFVRTPTKYYAGSGAPGHDDLGDILLRSEDMTEEFFDLFKSDFPGHTDSQAATVMLQNEVGYVLWGKRRKDGKWSLPGGHLEPGEHPNDGAIRELYEETGIIPDTMWNLGAANTDQMPVHMFQAVGHGEPTNQHDPDREFESYRWVDCFNGPPPEITGNLAHQRNVVYDLMGWVQNPWVMQKAEPYAGWHAPNLEEERNEFGRAAQEAGIHPDHLMAAAKKGAMGPLHPDLLNGGLDNYSGAPGMTLANAHEWAGQFGRNSQRIEQGFKAGKPMPAPIVVHGLPGKKGPHLLAGNTRTMVAHGMGIPVNAFHVHLGKAEQLPFMRAPAFRHFGSGEVFETTSGYHDLSELAQHQGLFAPDGEPDYEHDSLMDWEHGFVDRKGKFYNRAEAAVAVGAKPDDLGDLHGLESGHYDLNVGKLYRAEPIPFQEDPNQQRRRQQRKWSLVSVDAQKFAEKWSAGAGSSKTIGEAGKLEPTALAWHPQRWERAKSYPVLTNAPEVHLDAKGHLSVGDGRHRLAAAAARGGNVVVQTTPASARRLVEVLGASLHKSYGEGVEPPEAEEPEGPKQPTPKLHPDSACPQCESPNVKVVDDRGSGDPDLSIVHCSDCGQKAYGHNLLKIPDYERKFPVPKFKPFAPKESISDRWKVGKEYWNLGGQEYYDSLQADFEHPDNQKLLHEARASVNALVGASKPDEYTGTTIDPELPKPEMRAYYRWGGGVSIHAKDAQALASIFGGTGPREIMPEAASEYSDTMSTFLHELFHSVSQKHHPYSSDRDKALEESTTEILAEHYLNEVTKGLTGYGAYGRRGYGPDPLFEIDRETGEPFLNRATSYSNWVERFGKLVAHIEGLDGHKRPRGPNGESAEDDVTYNANEAAHDERVKKLNHMIAHYALRTKRAGYQRPEWLADMYLNRKLGVKYRRKDGGSAYQDVFGAMQHDVVEAMRSAEAHRDGRDTPGLFHHSRPLNAETFAALLGKVKETQEKRGRYFPQPTPEETFEEYDPDTRQYD